MTETWHILVGTALLLF